MWNYVIAAIVSLVIVYATRPKIENPPPASIDQFDSPTAEAGRPIPVLFGTKEIKGVNCVWYGDLRTRAIKVGGKK